MALQKRLEGLSGQAATLFSDVDVRMLDASVVVSELRPLSAKIKDFSRLIVLLWSSCL